MRVRSSIPVAEGTTINIVNLLTIQTSFQFINKNSLHKKNSMADVIKNKKHIYIPSKESSMKFPHFILCILLLITIFQNGIYQI